MTSQIASPLRGTGYESRELQQSSILEENHESSIRYRPPLTQEELKRKIQQFSERIDEQSVSASKNSIDLQESPKDRDDTYFGESSPQCARPPTLPTQSAVSKSGLQEEILHEHKKQADEPVKCYEPSLTVQDNASLRNISITRSAAPAQVVVRNVGIQKNCREQVESIESVEVLREVLNEVHNELYANVPIRSRVQSKSDCESVLSFAVETIQLMYDEIARGRTAVE